MSADNRHPPAALHPRHLTSEVGTGGAECLPTSPRGRYPATEPAGNPPPPGGPLRVAAGWGGQEPPPGTTWGETGRGPPARCHTADHRPDGAATDIRPTGRAGTAARNRPPPARPPYQWCSDHVPLDSPGEAAESGCSLPVGFRRRVSFGGGAAATPPAISGPGPAYQPASAGRPGWLMRSRGSRPVCGPAPQVGLIEHRRGGRL